MAVDDICILKSTIGIQISKPYPVSPNSAWKETCRRLSSAVKKADERLKRENVMIANYSLDRIYL